MTERDRIVVVGAGLIGLALAAELKKRGRDVVVLEKSIPGAEASTAAAGILGPQLEHDDDGPTLPLGLAGASATRRLLGELDDDVDLFDTGAVKLAFDDAGAAALERRARWQRELGLRVDVVDGAAARARLPWLAGDVVAAAFFPDDHCLDPRKYGGALARLCRSRGADVVSGAALAGLGIERGRCTGARLANGDVVAGAAVVVCAGAWSAVAPGVAQACGLTLDDVHPVRGQIVELGAGSSARVDRVVYGAGGYLVPRRDGRVVCGSTMERVGFDKSVTDDGVAGVRSAALRAVPSLQERATTSTWAGLRPATRDGLPLIGETRLPGLWLSTGHFRNGVLLAAVSAEIVAALVLGQDVSGVDVAPFDPKRLSSSR